MKTYLSSIPMRIYRFAKRTPDKTAVIDQDFRSYSYHELNSMADAIGDMLLPSPAKRIGILTGAGIKQIAAILAVVKSGASYLPLDPSIAGSSLRRIAADAGVDYVIVDKANCGRLGEMPVLELPETTSVSDKVNFIPMYFGARTVACSMPNAKGELQQLSCVAVRRHARYLCDEFGIGESDVVLQSAPASSPMFLAEVFATMMKGATLAILPEKNRGYAKAVADFAERAGVTIICGYRPMVEEIGLMKRLPSRLRMMLTTAGDSVRNTLAGFNSRVTWRGWFTVRRLAVAKA